MKVLILILCLVAMATTLPSWTRQNGRKPQQRLTATRGRQLKNNYEVSNMPMNYKYDWNVDDEKEQTYYGQKEAANNGRVEGSYYNLLPTGRLMRVDYYVEGDSGFVSKITYEDNYTPRWGTKFY